MAYAKRAFAVSFAVLGLLGAATSSFAQTPGSGVASPNDGYMSPEGSNDFFNDPSGPMDLIHRAILMNNMSLSDFRAQQGDRISTEADRFRQLQQEAIRNRQPVEAVDATDEEADVAE